ncbi:hypothetical protein PsorP6_006621 [Peronosclerospora sorghi]|uniref:Uncharacterized protein n=1 Tax=Peronosclerospora sorghi TaxID=230839 RepID=A0ACC0W4G4_9STRA|nr:hypothetical protein PsorP6_006621 [Peronosclerospora sorghi]
MTQRACSMVSAASMTMSLCKVKETPKSTAFVGCSEFNATTIITKPNNNNNSWADCSRFRCTFNCRCLKVTLRSAYTLSRLVDSAASPMSVASADSSDRLFSQIAACSRRHSSHFVRKQDPTPEVDTHKPTILLIIAYAIRLYKQATHQSVLTLSRIQPGGVGCIDDVCHFCKVFDTTQLTAFVNSTAVSG